jgi:tetratricopeptide (TPR) repeat protein
MVCNNCGHEIRTRKKYCTACGAILPKQVNLMHLWLIPLFTALVVIASVVSYTFYEEKIIKPRVQNYIEQGESYFILGDFYKAKEQFEKAKQDRPNNRAVIQSIVLVNEAIQIEKKIAFLKQELSEGIVTQPEETLKGIESELDQVLSEPLQSYFAADILIVKKDIALLNIERSIDETDSVMGFAKLFSNISYFHTKEADALRDKITTAFNSFIISEAKIAIASQDYGKAKAIVEFALQYNYENAILADFLKNSIQPYLND